MDIEARRRLKAELARLGFKANEVSTELWDAPTYLSRVINDRIKEPSASRITQLCEHTGIDWSFILTGEIIDNRRKSLIEKLTQAPEHLIDEVDEFVRSIDLGKSD